MGICGALLRLGVPPPLVYVLVFTNPCGRVRIRGSERMHDREKPLAALGGVTRLAPGVGGHTVPG